MPKKNIHPKFGAFHRRIMDDENKEYKVSFKRRLSFFKPVLINLLSKIRGKKVMPKAYIPGLIPCLNGRGFMEEDLNDVSKKARVISKSLQEHVELTGTEDFLKKMSLVSESLESVAIDINRVLETRLSEEDWQRYSKGDNTGY